MAKISIVNLTAMGASGGVIQSANNGVVVNPAIPGTNIQLGGPLVQNTSVTAGAFTLTFDMIQVTNGAVNPTDVINLATLLTNLGNYLRLTGSNQTVTQRPTFQSGLISGGVLDSNGLFNANAGITFSNIGNTANWQIPFFNNAGSPLVCDSLGFVGQNTKVNFSTGLTLIDPTGLSTILIADNQGLQPFLVSQAQRLAFSIPVPGNYTGHMVYQVDATLGLYIYIATSPVAGAWHKLLVDTDLTLYALLAGAAFTGPVTAPKMPNTITSANFVGVTATQVIFSVTSAAAVTVYRVSLFYQITAYTAGTGTLTYTYTDINGTPTTTTVTVGNSVGNAGLSPRIFAAKASTPINATLTIAGGAQTASIGGSLELLY